jgi:hypothetical protein
MFFNNPTIICDFSTAYSISKWRITNDTVMGGVSSSSMSLNEKGYGVFSGAVSTAYNGGFAMARLPVNVSLNNSQKKIVLRIKGDGNKYQLRLKSSARQRYWYVHSFQTTNAIETITIPLADFYPSYRGYRLNEANFSSDIIKEIAVLIGNKKNQQFSLLIDSITVE